MELPHDIKAAAEAESLVAFKKLVPYNFEQVKELPIEKSSTRMGFVAGVEWIWNRQAERIQELEGQLARLEDKIQTMHEDAAGASL